MSTEHDIATVLGAGAEPLVLGERPMTTDELAAIAPQLHDALMGEHARHLATWQALMAAWAECARLRGERDKALAVTAQRCWDICIRNALEGYGADIAANEIRSEITMTPGTNEQGLQGYVVELNAAREKGGK